MEKYNFDEVVDRKNTDSCKWDVKKGELPLWVADMDFETAPCVKNAIIKRAQHGVFGYNIISEKFYESYISWWKTRYDFTIEKDALIFSTGVIPSISSCVRKLTSVAEKVLVMTPVYNIFFNSIVNNGRIVKESPLEYDRENCSYSIDFSRLEADLKDPQVTLMILCNPHNPCGKIFTKEELGKIGDLCKKYSVTVIADEIHCDFTVPGKKYIPFASVSETCKDISVTCISPAKSFNIASLCTSAVVVFNPVLRHKVWRALNTDECAEPSAFALVAAYEAYMNGGEWFTQLNEYLFENRKYACDYIKTNCPKLKCVDAEATYLLWIDVSGTELSGNKFAALLREKTGLYICGGLQYGKGGENFIRINLACPRVILEDAMERLKNYCVTL